MSSLRRLQTWAVVVGLVLLLATSTRPGPSPAPDALEQALAAAGGPQSPPGACDVDGVDVAYRTAYRSAPALGYDVTDGVVSAISWPSCRGAVLSVVVGDGTTPDRARGELTLADANVSVAGGSAVAQVPLRLAASPSDVPDAAWISTVGVTLDGGTTPIPPECTGRVFATTMIGTNSDDVMDGTNAKADLIYTLEGADRVDGRQGADCVITGADALGDTVVVGNADNVVRTGAGSDIVTTGNGTQRISTQGGDDTITVGTGKGSYIDAGPGNDTCRIPKSVKQITVIGCETRVAT